MSFASRGADGAGAKSAEQTVSLLTEERRSNDYNTDRKKQLQHITASTKGLECRQAEWCMSATLHTRAVYSCLSTTCHTSYECVNHLHRNSANKQRKVKKNQGTIHAIRPRITCPRDIKSNLECSSEAPGRRYSLYLSAKQQGWQPICSQS